MFENKEMEMTQEAIFIHLDSGNAKADKPLENDAKKRGNMEGTREKKGIESNFGYILHSIMYRDYEHIKRFKTAI